MGGFDKIELTPKNPPPAPNLDKGGADKEKSAKGSTDFAKAANNSSFMTKRKKRKFKMGKRYSIALSIVAFILLLIGIPAYATYKSGLKTYREAKLISAAVKSQNIELAGTEIDKTKKYLSETQRNFHYMIPLKFVPIVSWYYNDADHMLNAGAEGLEASTIAVNAVKPYADVLGLKGQGSFSAGSAEDRIKTAVLTVGKITPQIDKIAVSLTAVQKEIDAVDPNHYPELIFGSKVKKQLTEIKQLTADGTTFVNDAKPLVKVLPSLLGEKEQKKYLVLFQNDKELRPTGGFITAYAIFTVDKGVIKIERSEDIYNLDDSISGKGRAPGTYP